MCLMNHKSQNFRLFIFLDQHGFNLSYSCCLKWCFPQTSIIFTYVRPQLKYHLAKPLCPAILKSQFPT